MIGSNRGLRGRAGRIAWVGLPALLLPGCLAAFGAGVTGAISTRGNVLVEAEAPLALAGRLAGERGTTPEGLWNGGFDVSGGLRIDPGDIDDLSATGSFGLRGAFVRYFDPESVGGMLTLGFRFGDAGSGSFFLRLRVGGEVFGRSSVQWNETSWSGGPEYAFSDHTLGFWLGSELVVPGTDGSDTPEIFFSLTAAYLARWFLEGVPR
jgi:hypothetical protein